VPFCGATLPIRDPAIPVALSDEDVIALERATMSLSPTASLQWMTLLSVSIPSTDEIVTDKPFEL
jgi:hypothetical protein